MTLPLNLYHGLTYALHAAAPALLRRRVETGKEDPDRYPERLGQTLRMRPDSPVIWFHGVSVGESLSAIPVMQRLQVERPDLSLLITTATTTSAEILTRRLPDGVIHQFAPIDTPQAVTAFLDHWQPHLAVFIESDIWPNTLRTLAARKIPHLLLSARITEKTFHGWQRFRRSMRHLLSGYSLIMPQDDASEARLRDMGVKPSEQANLKTLGASLPLDEDALDRLKGTVGDRRVIVAASTHYGEDNIIARALEAYVRDGDLLVLVPRHPVRAGDIRLDLEAIGLHVAQRTLNEPLTPHTQVYLADTLGELGLFFRLANLVIMGGSFLENIGGHNPLEAARLGKSVITGPDIGNWDTIYARLFSAGAAWRVQGPQELGFLVGELRSASDSVITAADAAALQASRHEAGTLDRVWQALAPLLPDKA